MPKIKQIKNPQKIFAVAYKIFTSLEETPTHSAKYAEMFSINVRVVKYIVTLMGQLGCIVTKRGGGKDSGIRRLPGVTVKDLFEKFKVPYREGVEFENEMNSFLVKPTLRPKACTICGTKGASLNNREWLCADCAALDAPLFQSKRLAKCGHYSVSRYFKCEECEPLLNENDTPDDLGYGVSMLGG